MDYVKCMFLIFLDSRRETTRVALLGNQNKEKEVLDQSELDRHGSIAPSEDYIPQREQMIELDVTLCMLMA